MEDNYKPNIVVFDPKEHRYYVNGKEVISVTTALKIIGLAPDYSNVDKDILMAKSLFGTHIHKELELFYKNNLIPFAQETSWVIIALEERGFKVIACETVVYDDDLGGTVDITALHIETNEIWVLDLKTTAKRDETYVTYQTNLYKKMHTLNVSRCGAIYLDYENEKADIVELPVLSKQIIELVYECIRERKQFQPLNVMLNDELNAIKCIDEQIKDYQNEIKNLEDKVAKFKEAVLEAMVQNCIKSCTIGNLHITLKNGYTRESVDAKALKKGSPETYAKYVKKSNVKPCLILEFKEEEKKDE